MAFTCLYLFVQHRLKYIENPSKIINILLLIFIILMLFGNFFTGVWNGINYLYQTLFGFFYGFCMLMVCLVFDSEFSSYCLKLAFTIKTSR